MMFVVRLDTYQYGSQYTRDWVGQQADLCPCEIHRSTFQISDRPLCFLFFVCRFRHCFRWRHVFITNMPVPGTFVSAPSSSRTCVFIFSSETLLYDNGRNGRFLKWLKVQKILGRLTVRFFLTVVRCGFTEPHHTA